MSRLLDVQAMATVFRQCTVAPAHVPVQLETCQHGCIACITRAHTGRKVIIHSACEQLMEALTLQYMQLLVWPAWSGNHFRH
jgi:hypothetical protein